VLLGPELEAVPCALAMVCVGDGRVCVRDNEASRKVYGPLLLLRWGAEGTRNVFGRAALPPPPREACRGDICSGSALRSIVHDAMEKSFLPCR